MPDNGKLEFKLPIGLVIQLIVIVATLAAVWGSIRVQLSGIEKQVQEMKLDYASKEILDIQQSWLRSFYEDLDKRVTKLEQER